ncbi:MAG: nucleotidyltransferase family protein [Bacteroidota bacterium]|nr:nucleotidyltransferase family protein [Bacteroidota bacterium]
MKAMIFAAGLGTRLKPLTDTKPKALIEINNVPLLQILILKLKKSGIKDIIINTHYFHEQIIEFLSEYENFDINIVISHEEELLDTGGGLLKASGFFDDNEPFLVHNVDVITDINIKEMLEFHKNSEALATLAVRKRKTNRYLLFNEEDILCGKYSTNGDFKFTREAGNVVNTLSFLGIHIISPQIFKYINTQGKFSITDAYLELSSQGHNIKGYIDNSSFWIDVGNEEKLNRARMILKTTQI